MIPLCIFRQFGLVWGFYIGLRKFNCVTKVHTLWVMRLPSGTVMNFDNCRSHLFCLNCQLFFEHPFCICLFRWFANWLQLGIAYTRWFKEVGKHLQYGEEQTFPMNGLTGARGFHGPHCYYMELLHHFLYSHIRRIHSVLVPQEFATIHISKYIYIYIFE